MRGVTWVGPQEIPVHIPNSLENLFAGPLNQVQVQEQDEEQNQEEEEEPQAQVQVEEGVPEVDWDFSEEKEH